MTHHVICYKFDVEIKSHFATVFPRIMRLRTRMEWEDSTFHYNIVLLQYFTVLLYCIEWQIVRRKGKNRGKYQDF